MATPSHIGEGAFGVSASVDPTVAWQVGTVQTDDIGILAVLCNGADSALTSLTDWNFITSATTGNVTDGVTISTFWRRATSSSEADVTLPLSGRNHIAGRISHFRGCRTTGSPIHQNSSGANASASTSFSATGFTTTLNECKVGVWLARGNDITGGFFLNQANSDLTSTAEEWDGGFTAGDGGGGAFWHGDKATAGTVGTTTGDISSSLPMAYVVLALTSQDDPSSTTPSLFVVRSSIRLT